MYTLLIMQNGAARVCSRLPAQSASKMTGAIKTDAIKTDAIKTWRIAVLRITRCVPGVTPA